MSFPLAVSMCRKEHDVPNLQRPNFVKNLQGFGCLEVQVDLSQSALVQVCWVWKCLQREPNLQ